MWNDSKWTSSRIEKTVEPNRFQWKTRTTQIKSMIAENYKQSKTEILILNISKLSKVLND